MTTERILVIDDDEIVARTIRRSLLGLGYEIEMAHNGAQGLEIARRNLPDLVILDVIMPGMDGYEVCRKMRLDVALENIPILFLTARVRDEDRITGFKAGADDYLCKPFNVDELTLRVRAILRRTKAEPLDNRTAAAENTTLAVNGYILHTRAFELETPHKKNLRLTPIQYDLLYYLMSHPGECFTPARLLDEVWDYPAEKGSADLVRVHIKTLRERVELDPSDPAFIVTVPGHGYSVGSEATEEK